MTPQKKAKLLIESFKFGTSQQKLFDISCKECALITVNNIIESLINADCNVKEKDFKFWQEVKNEINKL